MDDLAKQKEEMIFIIFVTYLHSPGLSQKPCSSSQPGRQIAAWRKHIGEMNHGKSSVGNMCLLSNSLPFIQNFFAFGLCHICLLVFQPVCLLPCLSNLFTGPPVCLYVYILIILSFFHGNLYKEETCGQ